MQAPLSLNSHFHASPLGIVFDRTFTQLSAISKGMTCESMPLITSFGVSTHLCQVALHLAAVEWLRGCIRRQQLLHRQTAAAAVSCCLNGPLNRHTDDSLRRAGTIFGFLEVPLQELSCLGHCLSSAEAGRLHIRERREGIFSKQSLNDPVLS